MRSPGIQYGTWERFAGVGHMTGTACVPDLRAVDGYAREQDAGTEYDCCS